MKPKSLILKKAYCFAKLTTVCLTGPEWFIGEQREISHLGGCDERVPDNLKIFVCQTMCARLKK